LSVIDTLGEVSLSHQMSVLLVSSNTRRLSVAERPVFAPE